MSQDPTPDGNSADLPEGDAAAEIGFLEALTWLGERRRFVAGVTTGCTLAAVVVALVLPLGYTARATLMPPGNAPLGVTAGAMAAAGNLGGLAGSLGAKTPEDLFVALLKSDSVVRALDARFNLKARYEVRNYETLRHKFPSFVRVAADRKSGVISIEVDDDEPAFAAELANAHHTEMKRLLARLAISEAQLRRAFFEAQVTATKEKLIQAETELRRVQENSGVIALDRQAEALISSAARLRALIAEREVQLGVLRTSATEQNPDVTRLGSEIAGLRSELARMESPASAAGVSAVGVGRLPAAAQPYVRALREMRLQESLLDAMVRQLELARLDEAKEGPALQVVDVAQAPDHKSRPRRALIVLGTALASLLFSTAWVVVGAHIARQRRQDPQRRLAWNQFLQAWRLRR